MAEYLNENKIPSMVCVATEYGESLLPQGEYLELSHERLDEKQMEERMLQMENGLVIDATHPYAQVVKILRPPANVPELPICGWCVRKAGVLKKKKPLHM